MKYMGSKSKIANSILPLILDSNKSEFYCEPFCGGLGSMDKVDNNFIKLANDYNPFLIAMWKGLQNDLDKPLIIDKILYNEYRNKFNSLKNNLNDVRNIVNNFNESDFSNNIFKEYFLIGWIGFMASFNGRFYDGGYSGKTETRDYIDEQIRNTLKQVDLLKNIKFTTYDYKDILYPPKSIIYCDIPYKETKQYSFSKSFNYDEFWDWCRMMTKQGHYLYISEYQAPEDFTCIWEKEVINSLNTTKTYKPIEKLFIYQ